MPPTVTVLIPVYNSERYVREAIDSVLGQTFPDFELIVVDDGSTDRTAEILASARDPRLRILRNPRNSGQTPSLNLGLDAAQGRYIARLDADDVAAPRRLEKQVAFMERHPGVGLLGTAVRLIGPAGNSGGMWVLPQEDLQIRWRSLLANPFMHPSVLIRSEILVQNGLQYDERFRISQDYDLWTRLLRHTRGANLGEPLVSYRVHKAGLTGSHRDTLIRESSEISRRTIDDYLPDFRIGDDEVRALKVLFAVGQSALETTPSQRSKLAWIYLEMYRAFESRYVKGKDLRQLRQDFASKAAWVFLRPPLPAGWPAFLRQLLAVYPSLPTLAIRNLPGIAIGRLKRCLGRW